VHIRSLIRILLSLTILAIFLSHSVGLLPLTIINQLENIAYDLRLNFTLINSIDENIVIVDIDEKSLKEIGRWPWSRDIIAELVTSLFTQYKIKTLGFDFLFAEPDNSSGINILEQLSVGSLRENKDYQAQYQALKPSLDYDRIFSTSFNGRHIVLGYIFSPYDSEDIGLLPKPISKLGPALKGKIEFDVAKGYSANLSILQRSASTAGFFDNTRVDIDGVFRRFPLIREYDDHLYESFSLAVARSALDFPTITFNITTNKENDYTAVEALQLGDLTILVDEHLAVFIPYRGEEGSFEYISATDIINKRVDANHLIDKIILIGTTAPGIFDLRSTPVQNGYPGVEIHANIISGILEQRIKHSPAYALGFEVVLLIFTGVLMILMLSYLSPLWVSVVSCGLLALAVWMNMLFWHAGIVLPLATIVLLIFCLFVLQMSYGYFVESRGKRAISKLFSQYIPPELVDEMADDPHDVSLQGISRDLTVLFSDVRGFTSISEHLNPQELTSLMNEILTPLTRVIHKHRGTIDKYMGDAIMAFWGAPLADDYHPKNAVLASLEMIDVLEKLQAPFTARGWPEIKVGVGINTGIMNVGNMGSEFRVAYTVMGDAVNLGSRLEGLTKIYGVSIIVSQSTKNAMPEFEFLELDCVKVKGKDEPVNIYEPIGYSIEIDSAEKSNARRFSQALDLYRQQNWDAAEREILSIAQQNEHKLIYKIYLDRIMQFRNHPPPGDWNGVFTHASK